MKQCSNRVSANHLSSMYFPQESSDMWLLDTPDGRSLSDVRINIRNTNTGNVVYRLHAHATKLACASEHLRRQLVKERPSEIELSAPNMRAADAMHAILRMVYYSNTAEGMAKAASTFVTTDMLPLCIHAADYLLMPVVCAACVSMLRICSDTDHSILISLLQHVPERYLTIISIADNMLAARLVDHPVSFTELLPLDWLERAPLSTSTLTALIVQQVKEATCSLAEAKHQLTLVLDYAPKPDTAITVATAAVSAGCEPILMWIFEQEPKLRKRGSDIYAACPDTQMVAVLSDLGCEIDTSTLEYLLDYAVAVTDIDEAERRVTQALELHQQQQVADIVKACAAPGMMAMVKHRARLLELMLQHGADPATLGREEWNGLGMGVAHALLASWQDSTDVTAANETLNVLLKYCPAECLYKQVIKDRTAIAVALVMGNENALETALQAAHDKGDSAEVAKLATELLPTAMTMTDIRFLRALMTDGKASMQAAVEHMGMASPACEAFIAGYAAAAAKDAVDCD